MINYPIRSYILKSMEISDITLDMVKGREHKTRWSIKCRGECLNKNNEWEYEPLPSSRDEAFYNRCRWDSAEEAVAFWEAHQ